MLPVLGNRLKNSYLAAAAMCATIEKVTKLFSRYFLMVGSTSTRTASSRAARAGASSRANAGTADAQGRYILFGKERLGAAELSSLLQCKDTKQKVIIPFFAIYWHAKQNILKLARKRRLYRTFP
jgi:hypothetical protein